MQVQQSMAILNPLAVQMSVEPVVNRLGWTDQDVERSTQNAQIIELLREIRDLLRPKPVGRPPKPNQLQSPRV